MGENSSRLAVLFGREVWENVEFTFGVLVVNELLKATGGATPLMYACQQCKENEVLEILRKQPYTVNDRDRTLKTPLHYCAENPNSNCAEIILKALPELVNAQDENGYCTLHLAVIAGNKPLIKLLIAKGADVNIHDNEGHSAVHWAIVSSEKEALEMIIRAGANPSTPDIHGGYPLHYAVQMCGCNCDYARNFEDAVRVVETLLNFGVDVNVKDKDGRQPILWAASAGSADAVIHLISSGACVEAADKDGLTALHCAASRGHTTTLETLITLCGANVDVIDGNGCSALFYSVTLGHADATELLLQLGAEPNRQDRKGRTPAHCGAAKGQLETLRILQKHGGNLWMRNVRGDIPLHEAVASGRKDLVLWLLSQCSEAINIANNDGRCPLHIASMYNNTEMVKVLLDSNSLVNPVMRTSKGVLMTPLNVALSKGHRSCGKYLQLHGGVPFSKVSQVEPASGLSIRISPSDYTTIEVTEKSRESGTPSQIDISKSRSSTDVLENQEMEKLETADKKKVYRRRKRKKNTSNTHTQGSDSDESVNDFRTRTPDVRKPDERGNNGDEKVKNLKVHKRASTQRISEKTKKTEISEEPATVTKVTRTTESKSLQRNKSFNETKNVSDLSPEDFPPLMQTINHLDIVIMEPDVDVRKHETENIETSNETKPLDAEIVDLGSHVTVESNKIVENSNILEKTTVIEEKIQKEEKSGKEEKQGKTEEGQKPNGKQETGRKSSEVSGRKSGKTSKSSSEGGSQKKETKPGQKPSSGSEESSNRKETPSPKVPKEQKQDLEEHDSRKGTSSPKVSKEQKNDLDENDSRKGTPSSKVPKEQKHDLEDNDSRKGSSSPKVSKDQKRDLEENDSRKGTPSSKVLKEQKQDLEENDNRKGTSSPKVLKEQKQDLEENDNRKGTSSPKVLKEQKQDLEENDIQKGTSSPKVLETSEKLNDLNANEDMQQNEKPKAEVEIKNEVTIKESTELLVEGVMEEVKKLESTTGNAKSGNEKSNLDFATLQKESFSVQPVEIPVTTEATEAEEMKLPETQPSIGEAKEEEKTLGAENVEMKGKILEETGTSVPSETVEIPVVGSNSHKNNSDDLEIENKKQNVQHAEELIKEQLSHAPTVVKRSVEFHEVEMKKPEEKDVEAEQTEERTNRTEEDSHFNPTEIEERDEAKEDEMEVEGEEAENEEVEGNSRSPQKKTDFSEHRVYKPPRVSRLCRRSKDFKDDPRHISVTQLVQNTIRKYHMERGIFYQLLELKRYQIRSGRANEQVLVKRLADEYERSRVFLGMKPFSGLYKFREFEKFLYDQLKALNSRRSFIIPDIKSYDDIDALSGFLKKSRYKIINETPPPELFCTCITQRCHHSACAYTSVPCSAYITDLHRHKPHRPRRESFFPRIDQATSAKAETQRHKERPATLELVQGSEKHVITLPENSPSSRKRYYVTFTIKGAPDFKEEDFSDESKDFLKHRHAKSV